jgi:hypothetical protein
LESDEFTKQDSMEAKFQIPVILTFMLDEAEAKDVNLTLDLILKSGKEKLSRSQALAYLARFYLERSKPVTGV